VPILDPGTKDGGSKEIAGKGGVNKEQAAR
jgi:hypothetical protein